MVREHTYLQVTPTHLHSHLLLHNAQAKTAKAKESSSQRTMTVDTIAIFDDWTIKEEYGIR
ncbi:MAG: hypothetical protein BGO32_01490 [Bacteroidetes bacterium 37-13]|nr:MAG: hypothetical protein BGO32_01490 [Bacteroidetes bacterium 37-13]